MKTLKYISKTNMVIVAIFFTLSAYGQTRESRTQSSRNSKSNYTNSHNRSRNNSSNVKTNSNKNNSKKETNYHYNNNKKSNVYTSHKGSHYSVPNHYYNHSNKPKVIRYHKSLSQNNHIKFQHNNRTYYQNNNRVYAYNRRYGYYEVNMPLFFIAQLPHQCPFVMIQGIKYYAYNGAYYRPHRNQYGYGFRMVNLPSQYYCEGYHCGLY